MFFLLQGYTVKAGSVFLELTAVSVHGLLKRFYVCMMILLDRCVAVLNLVRDCICQGQLFDGLDDDESRFDSESFVPKRSVRSLVIKSNKQRDSSLGCSPPSYVSVDDIAGHIPNSHNVRYR